MLVTSSDNPPYVGIYIHWPFCKSKCPYCDFNSHVREKIEEERWRNALLAELNYLKGKAPDFKVASIFFGGGTPSLMAAKTVEEVIFTISNLWKMSDNVEITLEANPTSAEAQKFYDFKSAGVNRVSIGVQSLDDKELAFLGREHSASEAIKTIETAKKVFSRYSFDLIYARPNQKIEEWDRELSQALTLAGGHLSLYQLTIEENTAFYHLYKKGGFILPSDDEAEELYLFTEEKMRQNDFSAYEVSNYAREGEESRHNIGYWRGDSYIGCGAGAHGRISINGKRIATQTLKSPERWLENVEKQGHALEIWQELSLESEAEEMLMMGVRLSSGINYNNFIRKNGYDLRDYINLKKRDLYTEQGLLENDASNLKTTIKGRLLLNRLTAELLNSF